MKRTLLRASVSVRASAPREAVSHGSLGRLAFAAALGCAVGCSAPEAERLDTSRQALFANDKAAYEYFIGKGLTNFQAAGVVGNLDQESGVDPAIHQAGGGVGRGIAQWSTGARWDTTNNDNVLQYAAAHGQSATSLALQLDFMWYELTTFPEYGLAQLKASTNITDATTAVEDLYEGCVYANFPECALPSRLNFAKGIFNAYGAETGTGGGGAGGGAGAAGAGGKAASGGASGASGAGGSSGQGVSGGAGASGSGGANAGGSSGSSGAVAGAGPSGGAGATNGGTSSAVGGVSVGGGANASGGASAAGNPSAGSSPSAAGSTSFGSASPASNDSSCTFSRPGSGRFAGHHALAWLAAGLLLSTLPLRRRTR